MLGVAIRAGDAFLSANVLFTFRVVLAATISICRKVGPDPRAKMRRWAVRILGGGAALLALFIVIGVMLPGRVEVTRSVEVQATPEAVFPFLNDLEAWAEWTPWAEVESRIEGVAVGVGARRVWDDVGMGAGSLTLVESEPPWRVSYLVEVEDGTLEFAGTISVEAGPEASLVSWTEVAELGWNPLMGWTALTLGESQGAQMQESLDRLVAVVGEAR